MKNVNILLKFLTLTLFTVGCLQVSRLQNGSKVNNSNNNLNSSKHGLILNSLKVKDFDIEKHLQGIENIESITLVTPGTGSITFKPDDLQKDQKIRWFNSKKYLLRIIHDGKITVKEILL